MTPLFASVVDPGDDSGKGWVSLVLKQGVAAAIALFVVYAMTVRMEGKLDKVIDRQEQAAAISAQAAALAEKHATLTEDHALMTTQRSQQIVWLLLMICQHSAHDRMERESCLPK